MRLTRFIAAASTAFAVLTGAAIVTAVTAPAASAAPACVHSSPFCSPNW